LTDSPYKFLNYYEPEDKNIFFGREKETSILLSDIVVSRLVVLFAKTGTGKTSLINAGVRPLLNERGYQTYFIRVSQDPTESVRKELTQHNEVGRLKRGTLYTQMTALAQKLKKPLVLFFDQFEEFFIYVYGRDRKKEQQFISEIAKLYNDRRSNVLMVFSMREEFFVEMDAFRDKIPTIFHNESNLRLRWFDKGQARDAIERPALAFGARIDKKLIDRIIRDLMQDGQIEPAQLQIVCDSLWKKKDNGRIKLSAYMSLGEDGQQNIARQVLNHRIQQEFDQIQSEQQLMLLERLLPLLRSERNTKYVREFDSLVKELDTDPAPLRELLETLKNSLFVRLQSRQDLLFIELSHDYLVPRLEEMSARVKLIWPRRLLNLAVSEYERGGSMIAPESLIKISEHAKQLNIDRKESELLFRSALAHGLFTDLWFDIARGKGVAVWQILSGKIKGDVITEAPNAVDLLSSLDSTEARKVLRRAVGRQELSAYVIDRMSQVETSASVKFLKSLLSRVDLAAQSLNALGRLAKSRKNPGVAGEAQKAISNAERRKSASRPTKKSRKKAAPAAAKPASSQFRATLIRHDIEIMTDLLAKGRLIPFIGPGVYQNLSGKPAVWRPGRSKYPPTDTDLALYFAKQLKLPQRERPDLPKVAQYYYSVRSPKNLYAELNEIFSEEYTIPSIYRALAEGTPPQIIFTTNYDDLIERAFESANRPFQVYTHVRNPLFKGALFEFLATERNVKRRAATPQRVGLLDETIICKILGSFNRQNPDNTQYIISETDHIEFGEKMSEARSMLSFLDTLIEAAAFLFLEYSLANRTQFAVLNSISRLQRSGRTGKSWAIQSQFSELERSIWEEYGTQLYAMPIERFARLFTSGRSFGNAAPRTA
jgi:hypothetical protein